MKRLYISMYHYTRDLENSRYPGIKGLDKKLFEQQLDFFDENFNVVTMEQVLHALDNKAELPEKALLLTFDDGYIDNFTVAYPLLKARGMQGSFFIPGKTFTENVLLDVNKIHFILASADIYELKSSLEDMMNYYRGDYDYPTNEELNDRFAIADRFDNKETVFVKRMLQTVLPEELRHIISSKLFEQFVGISEDKFARELYMNRDQIRHMKNDGMFIGLHGYDHYWLANLSQEDMERDIDKALDVMDEFIDKDRWVMNYPYGNSNTAVIDYIKNKGCVLGLTTEVRVADLEADSRYEMPRFDCNDFPPKSELKFFNN